MNIKETFLSLTSKTYPHGYEDELSAFLPLGYKLDDSGNYYYEVGKSNTIFASHLDTACKNQVGVIHTFDGKFIRTNGKSILGADDKAGVTILLYMIEKKVPGLYYFFIGEEVGCIGSSLASKNIHFFNKYNKMVSFDRRGTTSIITYQSSSRCCSDAFANSLSKEFKKSGLNLSIDPTGVYTDSAEFTNIIPECTNISVGYYSEHTFDEHQDIEFLSSLANAAVTVDWENLVISRDPSVQEVKKNDYYQNSNGYYYSGGKVRRYHSTNEYPDRDFGVSAWDGPDNKSKVSKSKRGKRGKGRHNDNSKKSTSQSINTEVTDQYFLNYSGNNYEAFKQMLYDDRLTKEELRIIKDQYLNMDDEEDYKFCRYLESVIL